MESSSLEFQEWDDRYEAVLRGRVQEAIHTLVFSGTSCRIADIIGSTPAESALVRGLRHLEKTLAMLEASGLPFELRAAP